MRLTLIPLIGSIALFAGCAVKHAEITAARPLPSDRDLEIQITLDEQSKQQAEAQLAAKQADEQLAEARLRLTRQGIFYILNSVPPTERIATPKWNEAFHSYINLGFAYDEAELMADTFVGGRSESPPQNVVPLDLKPNPFAR